MQLTDITTVRQFMQKSLSDKIQDADLETLIDQASEAIQVTSNREFAPPSAPKTRSFEFEPNNGYDLIDLTPYEFRSVEEVTIDPDITPKVLLASEYRQWPYPSADGTFFGLKFTTLEAPVLPKGFPRSASYPFGTRRVDVKARWGMLEVPPEIVHWTNATVKAWAEIHVSSGGARPGELVETPSILGFDLPPSVFYGLKKWARPTPAA